MGRFRLTEVQAERADGTAVRVFTPEAGIDTLHLPTDDTLRLLPALLRYLQDTGIGGERTSGKGHFRFSLQTEPLQLPQPDQPNAWLSLSHYLPTASEVQAWQNAPFQPCYSLVHRRARYEAMFFGGQAVYKPLRRLLAPGALLPLSEQHEVYGRAVQSGQRAGHAVWVCGRALPAFARIGGAS